MEKINVKKESWKLLFGLIYIIALISTIRYFQLGFWMIYLLFFISRILMMVAAKAPFTLKRLGINAISLLVLLSFFRFLGRFGRTGYVLGVVLICSLILFTRRKKWLQVKWHVESMLFGKPLKEFIKNKEKPPKLKLVLRK